jgi:hypothetical protein
VLKNSEVPVCVLCTVFVLQRLVYQIYLFFIYYLSFFQSHDSSFGIETRLWAGLSGF